MKVILASNNKHKLEENEHKLADERKKRDLEKSEKAKNNKDDVLTEGFIITK